MSSIRAAIVGAGGIANRHGLAIRKNDYLELVAVIDSNPENSAAFARR
jgi:predicted dehydrogenase